MTKNWELLLREIFDRRRLDARPSDRNAHGVDQSNFWSSHHHLWRRGINLKIKKSLQKKTLFGEDDGERSRNIRLHRATLCQLSYILHI